MAKKSRISELDFIHSFEERYDLKEDEK